MSLNTILATAPLTTQNYVLKATGTALGNSIIYDNGTNVGIGNTNTSFTLDVSGTGRFTGIVTFGSTLSNGTYAYTLPSATGTLALVGGSGVGTVTSVAALTIGTTGTDLSSTVATSTTTPVITLNVPTASAANRGALSSADWSTFNSKQGTITLTTTGTSGAATFTSNTLNIPDYGSALSGYLPLTGGTLTGALGGTSASFSGAVVFGAGTYSANVAKLYTDGLYGAIITGKTGTACDLLLTDRAGNLALQIINNGSTPNVIMNSGGNVGIGTSSPSQILDVRKATASGDTQFNFANSQNSSSGNLSVTSSIYLGFYDDSNGLANANKIVSGKSGDYTSAPTANSFLAFHTTNANTTAERMRITSEGYVGIGNSVSAVYPLVVKVATNRNWAISNSGTGFASFRAGDDGYNNFNRGEIDAIPLIINSQSGGNVLIGTTTDSGAKLQVNGDIYAYNSAYFTSTGATPSASVSGVAIQNPRLVGPTLFSSGNVSDSRTFIEFINANGVVGSISTSGTATAFNTSSDYRLKQDLKDYNGLELISAIKTYDYEWKSDKSRMYGVIAHELEEIIPYAGQKDAKEMQQVDYSKLTPINTKAIQELYQLVLKQQKQIEELKQLIK